MEEGGEGGGEGLGLGLWVLESLVGPPGLGQSVQVLGQTLRSGEGEPGVEPERVRHLGVHILERQEVDWHLGGLVEAETKQVHHQAVVLHK